MRLLRYHRARNHRSAGAWVAGIGYDARLGNNHVLVLLWVETGIPGVTPALGDMASGRATQQYA